MMLNVKIMIEIDDSLVKGLPAARENLIHYTEEAIATRLFGQGFMPDDVEIDSWGITTSWSDK